MSKKKALICTSLLVIIIFASWISTWFIKITETITLYDLLFKLVSPILAGLYISKMVGCFYEWLIKTEDNKSNKEDKQEITDLSNFVNDLNSALKSNVNEYIPLFEVVNIAKELDENGWKFEKK
jgi:hypothetical protein